MATDNFSAIRLLAAVAVVFGHSFPLTGVHQPGYLGSPVATLAVKTFFVISGYLISESWMRDPHVWRYLMRRSLRIFPALIVVCLFSILIVGPLLTSLSPGEYFGNTRTWKYLDNILLRPSYSLPGLFSDNIYPGAVNGSLWTLPVEFSMYLLLPIVLTLKLARYTLVIAAMALSVASVWFTKIHIPQQPPVFWGTNFVSALEMAPYFFWGAVYRVWVPRSALNLQFSVLLMVLLPLAFSGMPSGEVIALIIVPYLVLSLGYATPPVFGWIDRYGDISYGVYLYGFLCQQIASYLFPAQGGHWQNFLLAAPPTIILGALSWHMIERPALQLKPRRSSRKQLVPQNSASVS